MSNDRITLGVSGNYESLEEKSKGWPGTIISFTLALAVLALGLVLKFVFHLF
jgi:hypothetical protein